VLAVVLFGLSLVLLAAAVVVAVWGKPVEAGRLPVGIEDGFPPPSFVLAACVAAAGFFVGLAALYAAAAMRVLARDRRIPQLSPDTRQLRGALLTSFESAAVRPAGERSLPPGKLPDEQAARPPLRLTVLLPAWRTAPRRSRPRPRHAGAHRGQRDDPVSEVSRREARVPDAMPGHHPGDAEPAGALAARMRWQRGALENIGANGLTRATLRYWLQQIAIGYGTIALNSYLLLLLLLVVTLLARRRAPVRLVLGRPRHDLRHRTRRHRLGCRLESTVADVPARDRDRLRRRPPGRLRQSLVDIATG
jgi:hypothetical protein